MAAKSMVLRTVTAAAAALFALGAFGQELDALRFYPAAEYTRLVIEADTIPDHRLRRLDNPPRLVLDIISTSGDELLAPIASRDLSEISYLDRIRAARNNAQRLRIVFDLHDSAAHSLFTLDPGHGFGNRLVLDIAAAGDSLLLRDLGFARYAGKSESQVQSPSPVQSEPAPIAVAPEPEGYRVDRYRVFIDPGHGGEDPGAIAANGKYEKDIVLDIAQRLYDKLESAIGIDPIISRDQDIFLPLASRVRRAHAAEADLFISLHADSAKNRKASGAAVFTLSEKGASSKFAEELANRANLSDVIGGVNLELHEHDRILQDTFRGLGREGKERSSKLFAVDAIEHLERVNGRHGTGLHSAGFLVLKSPQIPSVLVEVGFLSNLQEAERLSQPAFRERIATELANAVQLYFSRYSG